MRVAGGWPESLSKFIGNNFAGDANKTTRYTQARSSIRETGPVTHLKLGRISSGFVSESTCTIYSLLRNDINLPYAFDGKNFKASPFCLSSNLNDTVNSDFFSTV